MSLTLVNSTDKTAIATTHLDIKGKPVEVLVVGQASAYAAGELADQGRYYLSPTIAKTAFEDIELGRDHTPVFEGRTKAAMLSYLNTNTK